MIRSCCYYITEPVISSYCVHLKLGHRFHALLNVCSDRDDIYCPFNQFASVLKNNSMPLCGIIFGKNPFCFLAITNFCCQWARSGHTNKRPFHWHLEFCMASLFSALSFFARNHAIVSCYATARPGISAQSNRLLPPFMWTASWQWRLIRL